MHLTLEIPTLIGMMLKSILVKFQPEKYDFDVYKGFFLGKMDQIRQILGSTPLPTFQVTPSPDTRYGYRIASR
jgi:hypothetical protein